MAQTMRKQSSSSEPYILADDSDPIFCAIDRWAGHHPRLAKAIIILFVAMAIVVVANIFG